MIWNAFLLIISYLFYRNICISMNAHLKSRRDKRERRNTESRRESISMYGDVLHLDASESELLRNVVWSVFCILLWIVLWVFYQFFCPSLRNTYEWWLLKLKKKMSKEIRQPLFTNSYLSFDWFASQRCYVVSNLNRLNLRSLPFLLRKGLIFQHVTCCNTWNIQKMQRLKNSDCIPTVSKHTLLISLLCLKQHHSHSFNCLCLSNRAKWHLQSYTCVCSLFLPTDLHIPLPYSHQQKYSSFFHHEVASLIDRKYSLSNTDMPIASLSPSYHSTEVSIWVKRPL